MSTAPLSSPLARRFWAYLRERYDPAQFVPFHLLLVAAVGGVVRTRFDVGLSAGHGLAHLPLAALLLLFYFVLRVLDEHKDWEVDRIAYPERALSRGLVTHRHLRGAAWIAAAGMVVLALPFGPILLAGVAGLLGYALLMLREFFAGAWLRRHFVLYGVSHNLVVFLSVHVVALGFGLAAGLGGATLRDPAVHLAAAALNGLVFSLEVARKIRMPEAERAEVDTYSKVLGVRASALLVPGVQVLSLGMLMLVLPLGPMQQAGIALAMLAGWGIALRFLRRPTKRGAERLVRPASLVVLFAFVVLASLGAG